MGEDMGDDDENMLDNEDIEENNKDEISEEEKSAEISRLNKEKVAFTKPTVKYIISHHSGTPI